MTSKEYLLQVRNVEAQIGGKMAQIERLRDLAERRTSAYGETVRGGKGDRYDIVAEIADQLDALDAEIRRLLGLQARVTEAIRTVEDRTLRTLLELRYLSGMTWEQVAQILHYDVSWVYPLHNRALKVLQIPDSR